MISHRSDVVIASEAKESRGTPGGLRLLDRRAGSLVAMTTPIDRIPL
jgi:hypothetical protein